MVAPSDTLCTLHRWVDSKAAFDTCRPVRLQPPREKADRDILLFLEIVGLTFGKGWGMVAV